MIQLLDARPDSLTVTWPTVSGAKRYVLELKSENGDGEFRELSSKLSQPQAKKKNLTPNQAYSFRVAPVTQDETRGSWITHEDPFLTLSEQEGEHSMEAPTTAIGGNQALTIRWKAQTEATGYELQMRENKGGEGWTTIAASLSGIEVRKKNLTSSSGYQFRVRPSTPNKLAFSPPSEPMVAKGLSEALRRRWFHSLEDGRLVQNNGGSITKVPLADALGGKEFVLFYVSAHWCPPCRKFTPMLANWYKTIGKPFAEVVFVSADHDEAGFEGYFRQSHPWMAINYDDDTRENLMAALQVQGIPRLVVVDASSGNIVENNAVGKPLDLNTWRNAAQRR